MAVASSSKGRGPRGWGGALVRRTSPKRKRLPTSTMPKRMSKIWKSALEFEVDLAYSSPSRKSPWT